MHRDLFSWDLWRQRFVCAFRGVRCACTREKNFVVHGLAAVLVLIAAGLLGVSIFEWCVLFLCIGVVLAAEMFNTSLELLARQVHPQPAPLIGQALDIAAGAVLICSITAALVGASLLGTRLWAIYSAH